ncbi:MAG TPA: HAMP domain-containing sensor histidine kinase, partial [Ktedonobacterales bacterium]|nr:HAMP domain-containing sensor histidine kinase [Ktedonobacterales bacterium]
TPLTAIEGYVTLINKHGHRLDQAKLSQFATEIHHATIQLAGMISMLADANRMNNQPLQVTLRVTNLREMANQARGTQSPEAKERIQNDIPDDIWVMADDERLSLVFSNLISNAIKYSPDGSPCTLLAKVASRSELASQGRAHAQAEHAPERWVVVTVRDQGPGISPEDQAKLFQKFVRLTHSLTTAVRGTGLGLWICRQYVTAMGGDIWVESAVQRGASFSFSLPLAPPPHHSV